MTVDTLSDVLHHVRLTGTVFFDIDVYAPWVAEAPPSHIIAPNVLPGAEHVIEFHAIIEGSCYAGWGQDAPVRLTPGDVVAFVRGDAHVMSSDIGLRAHPDLAAYRQFDRDQLPLLVRTDRSTSARTRLVSGFVGFATRPFNPLFTALPPVLTIRQATTPESGSMAALLRLMVAESEAKHAGGEATLARLAELLFVAMVRRHIAELPTEAVGWLASLRDDSCGRALSLMHANPGDGWTVDSLAREVSLSRSTFAERFSRLVGMPAMEYLSEWRIQVASGMLLDGVKTVSDIGDALGYSSEATFSRAFKRIAGEAPKRWRRDGARHDGVSHDGASHDGASHDGASHDGASHDGASHDGVPQGGAQRALE